MSAAMLKISGEVFQKQKPSVECIWDNLECTSSLLCCSVSSCLSQQLIYLIYLFTDVYPGPAPALDLEIENTLQNHTRITFADNPPSLSTCFSPIFTTLDILYSAIILFFFLVFNFFLLHCDEVLISYVSTNDGLCHLYSSQFSFITRSSRKKNQFSSRWAPNTLDASDYNFQSISRERQVILLQIVWKLLD